jgi:hypothetical protein
MYLGEILEPQKRHFPRRIIQLNIGNMSYHFSRLPQEKQWEGSLTMDWCSGVRYITTFRKLPIAEPKRNTNTQEITFNAVIVQ